MAYTYYNSFYVFTSQDKDKFTSQREEAINGIGAIEKSADEINGGGNFFCALKRSNSNLLGRLSSRLKFV